MKLDFDKWHLEKQDRNGQHYDAIAWKKFWATPDFLKDGEWDGSFKITTMDERREASNYHDGTIQY